MKVNITVDCTPEEARAFMGLPNVAPLQEAAMKQMQAQMEKAAQSMDPETIMKTMFPMRPENLADMQKAFWASFSKTSE
jgi:tetrahydromethanopterin S-methyltransferase subunit B